MEIAIVGFILICIWVSYCLFQYKIDLGELFMNWILKYKGYWILTMLLIIVSMMYVYDYNVFKQRYDDLYKYKEEIFNELLQEQVHRRHLEVYGHWYEYQRALDSLEACDGIDRGNSIDNLKTD